ncbi:MAG TPA: P-loop NTPase [Burkholderiaceae bacterium]|jgi:flagellar biosynthesis protein FlhG|nr:P-loop NTPase [Burkholderiaceae bacterium]
MSGGGKSKASVNTAAPHIPGRPVLAITSGRGGTGKASLCLNLAAALTRRGLRVLVIDADLGMTTLARDLGLGRVTTLGEQHLANAGFDSARLPTAQGFELIVVGMGGTEFALLNPEADARLREGITRAGQTDDIVLLNAGSNVSEIALYAVGLATHALLVSTSEADALSDTYALSKVLVAQRPSMPLGLVVTQVAPGLGTLVHRRMLATLRQHADPNADLTGIGEIPDVAFAEELGRTSPVASSPGFERAAYNEVAARVLDWLSRPAGDVHGR